MLSPLRDELEQGDTRMYRLNVEMQNLPAETPVASIGWHAVRAEEDEAFERVFRKNRGTLMRL